MTDTTTPVSQPLKINATIDNISISFDESYFGNQQRNRMLISWKDKNSGMIKSQFVSLNTFNQIQIKDDSDHWVTYDIVKGSRGNNSIDAGTAPRIILADAGNDTITTIDGDIIDGGTGKDTVYIRGLFTDYTGSWRADGAYLLKNKTSNIVTVLRNVETVDFFDADGALLTVLNLGTKNIDIFNYDYTYISAFYYDGRLGTDRLVMTVPYIKADLRDFLITLDPDDASGIMLKNLSYQTTAHLKDIEQIGLRTNGTRTTEIYNIKIGTSANDSFSDLGNPQPQSAIVLGGDGNDLVQLFGPHLYLDLGAGDDTATGSVNDTNPDHPLSDVVIHGGLGNDFYQYNYISRLDYSNITGVDHVSISMQRNTPRNGFNNIIKVIKYDTSGRSVGTDTITTNNDTIDIVTGDGNDILDINCGSSPIAPHIDAGLGHNTINLYWGNRTIVYFGKGANTVNLVYSTLVVFAFDTLYAHPFTNDIVKGYKIDIGYKWADFYGNNPSDPIRSTWNADVESSAIIDVSANGYADTVIGSNGADTVYLGGNDTARLAGASDTALVFGNATVDGGDGKDTINFGMADLWAQSLSIAGRSQKLSFSLDIGAGTATWTRTIDAQSTDTLVSNFSHFEDYVITIPAGTTNPTKDDATHWYDLQTITVKGTTRDDTIEFNSPNARTIDITGGGGADTFVFSQTISPQLRTNVKFDDFGNDDTIDLTAIDAVDSAHVSGQWLHLWLNGTKATLYAFDNRSFQMNFDGGTHKFTKSDFKIDTTFTVFDSRRPT